MHIKKECDKRIRAYHLGGRDARDKKQCNPAQVEKACRKAYKNGFKEGQGQPA